MAGCTCWAARRDAGGMRGTVHSKMQGGAWLGGKRDAEPGMCWGLRWLLGVPVQGETSRALPPLLAAPLSCAHRSSLHGCSPFPTRPPAPPGGTPAPHMLVPAMPGPMPPALPTTERRGVSISRGSRQRANSARYSVLICGARRGQVGLGQGRAGVRGCPWGRRAEAQPRALPCWSVPAAGGGAASRSSAASPSVAERQRRGRAQGSGVPSVRPRGPGTTSGRTGCPTVPVLLT